MFGTDGVRGTPGRAPLDGETIARLGAATARVLARAGRGGARLLVVRDTRESGPGIEQHLARGVTQGGGTLVSAGVLPTPAAAFLASSDAFDGALVISASHNPFPDNGIKVLTADGQKASPSLETEIEGVVTDGAWRVSEDTASSVERRDLSESYRAFAMGVLAGGAASRKLRVAADCANGAMYEVAPAVLRDLGFDVVTLNAEPNGRNINEGCGSTHPEGLQAAVLAEGCDVGLAFDGDGDRVILVDPLGHLVDGDAMLFICASFLRARDRLPGNAVVATVMSNIGLEVALRAAEVEVQRCSVGDRQVRDAMVQHGIVLGGEQSGHLIFSELLPTGDGLLTALSVIRVLLETGRGLVSLRHGLEVYPQVLVNVVVRAKPDLVSEPKILQAIREAERTLGADGRVVVRYSGTEPLLRVMIEGRDQTTVQRLADTIADCARAQLG